MGLAAARAATKLGNLRGKVRRNTIAFFTVVTAPDSRHTTSGDLHSMKAIMLALPLLPLATAVQARDSRAEIDAANAKLVAAFNKGDAAAVAQLYTEQASALPPGAPMARGRAAIQAFWQGAIQSGGKNASLKTLQLDRFGGA